MANKSNKGNHNRENNDAYARSMQQYDEKRGRLNRGARIIAIVVIAAMLVTSFLMAGIFLFD